ncbi:serine/threonine-protein phosphatase [Streptomyces sp. NBC_01800]|nr:serine/threonine-protein phosphatase [Streptomyces sp. NBC_01800]
MGVEQRVRPVVPRLTEGEHATALTPVVESLVGATCLYLVYDPVSRRCTMASAGHPPPVIVDVEDPRAAVRGDRPEAARVPRARRSSPAARSHPLAARRRCPPASGPSLGSIARGSKTALPTPRGLLDGSSGTWMHPAGIHRAVGIG